MKEKIQGKIAGDRPSVAVTHGRVSKIEEGHENTSQGVMSQGDECIVKVPAPQK